MRPKMKSPVRKLAVAIMNGALVVLTAACGGSSTSVATTVPTIAQVTAVPTVPAVTNAPTTVPIAVPTEAPTAAPTQVPSEVPAGAPTAGPTEGPTEIPTAVPGTSLVFLVAITQDELNVLKSQIGRFEGQTTGITVELRNVPFIDFNDTLFKEVNAGNPPDVAILSYNHVVALNQQNKLQPLQINDNDRKDFLSDALNSNTFNERLVALPWVRSECQPRYRNLALFEASKFHSEGAKLIDFLTQSPQQEENFKALTFYPTRQSVYGQQKITCPDPAITALRFPQEVGATVALVEQRRSALAPLLDPRTINSYESAPLKQRNELQGAAAAVTDPISKRNMEAKLKEGVYVGALFVNATVQLLDSNEKVVETIEPGDYAVKWQGDLQTPSFFLVTPSGKSIQLKSARFQALQGTVGPPAVETLPGSWQYCWDIDDLHGCITLP
jgi:hypothetical protein